MNSNTTCSDLPSAAQGVVFDLGGLYAEFEKLSDKRKPRGKRYALALVLVLMALAKLCGEDLPSAIAQWISDRACYLIALMGLSCQRLPCLNTLRRVLQGAVDLGQLQEAMSRFLRQSPTVGYDPQVAIDGKALRSSPMPGLDQVVRLLAAYAPGEGVVLFQVAIPGTESELTAAPLLLQRLDLRGKIVMGDALFTQRELSVQTVQAGGDYIWPAKDNQPRVREAIERLFLPPTRTPGWGTPPDDFQVAQTCNKGHGRLEERILTSSELLNGYLDWPCLAQVFKIERHCTKLKEGTHRTQVVYGLTSLSRERADATHLLALVRNHWGIENGLHYRRDATLHEDATRMTCPALAQAMALFNNLVIGLLTQHGWRYLPEARRHYDAHPQAALALLLHPSG